MRALIGLGGNLGDVTAAFTAAVATLATRCNVLMRSSQWSSAPLGPAQPAFENATMLVAWDRHPLELLALALELEAAAGRDRHRESRWGPRPLDVDLLLIEGLVLEGPSLTLPHPRVHERRFALLPAAELVPEWLHPRLHRTLRALEASLDPVSQPCERRGPFPSRT